MRYVRLHATGHCSSCRNLQECDKRYFEIRAVDMDREVVGVQPEWIEHATPMEQLAYGCKE